MKAVEQRVGERIVVPFPIRQRVLRLPNDCGSAAAAHHCTGRRRLQTLVSWHALELGSL
jgi:hypothetical protein